jgi:hypothetical protein
MFLLFFYLVTEVMLLQKVEAAIFLLICQRGWDNVVAGDINGTDRPGN